MVIEAKQLQDGGKTQEHSSAAGTRVTLMYNSESNTRDAAMGNPPGKEEGPWARLQPLAGQQHPPLLRSAMAARYGVGLLHLLPRPSLIFLYSAARAYC